MAIRRWLAGGLTVCAMAGVLWARPGTVKTRDGVSYQGDVTENDDGKVVVRVHNIPMTIDRHDVATIEYDDEAGADFKSKLAALPPHDAVGRMAMARDAYNQKHYDAARLAAQAAVQADPSNADATEFLKLLSRQTETTPRPAAEPAPAPAPAPVPAAVRPAGGAVPQKPIDHALLSADEINVIRQAELTAQDTNFRVSFANDVRKRFVDKDQQGTLPDFMKLPQQQQARLILSRAPEMANDVRILSDPVALSVYKRSVQPALMNGCATASCHGGAQAGQFALISPAESDAASYTNFYILTQYSKQQGHATLSAIDRTSPTKSLIVQYALPISAADGGHPDVPGYKGIFRPSGDMKYKAVMDWLTTSLTPVQPEYGIKTADTKKPSATTQPPAK